MKRTKSLVFDAFFKLVQTTRYDELKAKDIIAEASIGRSTFYEHFVDKDDVLSQSLAYPMFIFANVLVGEAEHTKVQFMLNHFWDRRAFARLILKQPTREVVDDCLRSQIINIVNGTELAAMKNAHASFLSSGFLSVLNEWLVGSIAMSCEEMCEIINTYGAKSLHPHSRKNE